MHAGFSFLGLLTSVVTGYAVISSAGYGRDDPGTVSPDDIPNRAESDEPEMMNDLIALLRKQSTPNLNLVDLFHFVLGKEGGEMQRKRFGPSQAAVGRHMIVQTIERYAQATQNWQMLRLLDRFRERYPSRFAAPQTPRRRVTGAGTM
jgi:hypothetical protein